MDDELRDRLALRDLIENWVVWRDGIGSGFARCKLSDEAIQIFCAALDCFAEPVTGGALRRPVGSQ
jgi:hypothetical protein